MPSFDGQAYLNTFLNWESKLHQAASGVFLLERMERLLIVLGKPDDKLRFAHVAGTKGKGSTCAFLASIMRAAGYRVGLYTSPHLYSVCERIRILDRAGAPDTVDRRDEARPRLCVDGTAPFIFEGTIPWSYIEDTLRYYHEDIDQLRTSGVEITFYELITAVAMHYFAAQKVDLVVLETGLGGRLDATNIFETSVCGITPIGFDHTAILGNTIAAIAGEKAGIIKSPGQRVSLAPQPVEALQVIEDRCRQFGIYPSMVGKDVPYTTRHISLQGVTFDVDGRRKYTALSSPLTGEHQVQNATLAIAMAEDLETFGFVIDEDVVHRGVSEVLWPARFEKIAENPTIIIDGAHTVESARALKVTWEAVYPGRKAVVVVGMSADKNTQAFLDVLGPITQELILAKADHPRAMDWGHTPSVKDAMEKARALAGWDGIILVTGSLFVCAQVRG